MAIHIINPSIPFVGQIDKFTPQQSVRIQGTISQLSYGFNINLQCGPNGAPQQDDIALQISVRYFNGYICLNSFRHGTWDKDLCISPIPMKCDENFEIVVLCEIHQYKVIINGLSQYDFPQRISYDKVSHLIIEGDVSIAQIFSESVSQVPIVLDMVDYPGTTNVQNFEFQPAPVVKPGRKILRLVGCIFTIIGLMFCVIAIIREINIKNNKDKANQVLKLDLKDWINN